MSDVDLPVTHVRAQVASAIDLVVHTARLRDGRRVGVPDRGRLPVIQRSLPIRRAIHRGRGVEMTAHAYALLDSYIYGIALQEASLPFQGPESASEVAEPMTQPFPTDAYPHLIEMATEYILQPGYDFGNEFQFGLDVIFRAPHPDDSQRRHRRRGAVLARRAGGFEKGEHCHDPAIHLPFLDEAQLLVSTQRAALRPAGFLNGLTGGQSEQRSHCRVPDPCGHGVAGRTGRQRTLQQVAAVA